MVLGSRYTLTNNSPGPVSGFGRGSRSPRARCGSTWARSIRAKNRRDSLVRCPRPTQHVQLTWQSGTYKGINLAGYRVYGEPTAGGGIDYTCPLADLTAYPAGILTDGFGLGGFGSGGWGQAASTISWTSDPLAGGSWQFAVVPYDEAGNEGAPQTAIVSISAPPGRPHHSRVPRSVFSTTCSPTDRHRLASVASGCLRLASPGTHHPSRRRASLIASNVQ